jgi:predicted nicotinamide N-methyase
VTAAAGAPSPADGRAAFIRANTRLLAPPLAPEMRLHLADEAVELWTKTEAELQASGLPPPFWAFAWAGGQALARWIGDHPERVAGRRVLDFASGSGIVAIAAALAGAKKVEASEIDPFAQAAIALNAGENHVAVDVLCEDVIGADHGWDVVLAGDVAYERDMAAAVFAWLEGLARRGALALVGDPRRSYLALDRLECVAEYSVPTTRALEDAEIKRTGVFAFKPAAKGGANAVASHPI